MRMITRRKIFKIIRTYESFGIALNSKGQEYVFSYDGKYNNSIRINKPHAKALKGIISIDGNNLTLTTNVYYRD